MTDEQMDLFDGRQEFLQGPWIEMLKDLDMDGGQFFSFQQPFHLSLSLSLSIFTDPSTSHLLEYTIASALTQVGKVHND